MFLVYKKTMVPIKKIAAALKRRREIELAYLFGSAAKGNKHPKDVDVAVLAFQVIRYGKLLVERRPKADRDFKVRTMTRYHDAKPLHDFFYKQAMER